MQGTYNFNIGNQNPYMTNPSAEQSIMNIEQQIAQLNNLKEQFTHIGSPVEGNIKLWEEIDKEISSLNDEQKALLAQDKEYIEYDTKLQVLIQGALINLVKDKIAATQEGKELLEKQYLNIKDKKKEIINRSNKEMELFKSFKQAAQTNPNLTYSEFINNIK